MFKKLTFLCLLCQSILLHAQEVAVNKTKEFTIKDYGNSSFLKLGNNYFREEVDYGPAQFGYTAKLSKVNYEINIYSYDADMKEMQKFSLGDKKKMGPFTPRMFTFSGALYILYYRYSEENTIKIYLDKINAPEMSVSKTAELFTCTQKDAGIFNSENAFKTNKLFVSVSPDSTTMMIGHSNDKTIYSCIVDRGFNIINNTTVSAPQPEGFYVASALMDKSNNKYFGYRYVEDKEDRRGILIEDIKGKKKFQLFSTGNTLYGANDLQLAASKDNSKIYIYSNYYGDHHNEGVVLASVDTGSFTINKPHLFAYPEALMERLGKDGFGHKEKGKYTLIKIVFDLNEFENGTIALTGFSTNGGAVTAGSIINLFISKAGKGNFIVIPRKQGYTPVSGVIATIAKEKLVCIYADMEKNIDIAIDKKPEYHIPSDDMILIAAIIDSNGNIISRKKIADKPGDKNYYYISANILIGNHSYLLPVGHLRANMSQYFTEYNQFAIIDVQ